AAQQRAGADRRQQQRAGRRRPSEVRGRRVEDDGENGEAAHGTARSATEPAGAGWMRCGTAGRATPMRHRGATRIFTSRCTVHRAGMPTPSATTAWSTKASLPISQSAQITERHTTALSPTTVLAPMLVGPTIVAPAPTEEPAPRTT